jgi:penicillin-binding protein 1C
VFSEAAAFLVSDVLADRESRSPTFGLESPLATRFWTAVKTGTSKDMHDNWCVGFSRRYTVGVWVGNLSGDPMHDVTGITGAAPVWLEIMERLHRDEPSAAPLPPPGVVTRSLEPIAGRAERMEWFLAGTEPPDGLAPATPARIASPARGAIVALDPDIPAEEQRVSFVLSPRSAPVRWRLDGREIGADALELWPPTRGRHHLVLVDSGGHEVDRVAFEVR